MKLGRGEPPAASEIGERERERFEERATIHGFKYP
jgi:hypothetical protein